MEHFEGDIREKHFAVWGLAFKPNTDDMREAPSVPLIKRLLSLGASVTAYDPAAMDVAHFYLGDKIEYAESELEAVKNADALLILTEWNEFRNVDFNTLRSLLKESVVFDGRNIFDPDEICSEGFSYYSIGRQPVLSAIKINGD